MTTHRKAQFLTLAVLLAGLGIGLARSEGWQWLKFGSARASSHASPEDAVCTMVNAARAGDVRAYLASFSSPLQASLRRAVEEQTEAGFAKYLRDSNAPVRGVAVSDPQSGSGSSVRVRVEYIYQDRNEAQILDLEKIQNEWKISGIGSSERITTLIPYGTPIH